MDKPSDKVNRPFMLPGDEASITADFLKEHPEERAWYENAPPEIRQQYERHYFDRAMEQREALLRTEDGPLGQYSWPQSQAAPLSEIDKQENAQREEQRRALHGGLSDDAEGNESRAVESKPFRV